MITLKEQYLVLPFSTFRALIMICIWGAVCSIIIVNIILQTISNMSGFHIIV